MRRRDKFDRADFLASLKAAFDAPFAPRDVAKATHRTKQNAGTRLKELVARGDLFHNGGVNSNVRYWFEPFPADDSYEIYEKELRDFYGDRVFTVPDEIKRKKANAGFVDGRLRKLEEKGALLRRQITRSDSGAIGYLWSFSRTALEEAAKPFERTPSERYARELREVYGDRAFRIADEIARTGWSAERVRARLGRATSLGYLATVLTPTRASRERFYSFSVETLAAIPGTIRAEIEKVEPIQDRSRIDLDQYERELREAYGDSVFTRVDETKRSRFWSEALMKRLNRLCAAGRLFTKLVDMRLPGRRWRVYAFSQAALDEYSPEKQEFKKFLAAIRDAFPNEPFTSIDVRAALGSRRRNVARFLRRARKIGAVVCWKVDRNSKVGGYCVYAPNDASLRKAKRTLNKLFRAAIVVGKRPRSERFWKRKLGDAFETATRLGYLYRLGTTDRFAFDSKFVGVAWNRYRPRETTGGVDLIGPARKRYEAIRARKATIAPYAEEFGRKGKLWNQSAAPLAR